MFKTLGFILLVFVVSVMFIAPVRNFINNLLHRDKAELREGQIIGTVSGYNPRVEEIQQLLKDAGFEPGSIDGLMGGQTRRAIREFQKEKGLWPTGKIDSKTWLELNREKEALKKEVTSQPLVLPSEEKPPEKKSKEEIAKIMGPQEKAIKEKLPKDRKKQIQIALQKSGFYKGKIDGKIGPQTRQAIREFQKSKGLRVDGVMGSKTWEELKKYLKD